MSPCEVLDTGQSIQEPVHVCSSDICHVADGILVVYDFATDTDSDITLSTACNDLSEVCVVSNYFFMVSYLSSKMIVFDTSAKATQCTPPFSFLQYPTSFHSQTFNVSSVKNKQT